MKVFPLVPLALLVSLAACDGSVNVLSTTDGGSDGGPRRGVTDARSDALATNDAGKGDDARPLGDAKTSSDAVTDAPAPQDVMVAKGCLPDGGVPPLFCSSTSECPCPLGCFVNSVESAAEGETVSTCEVACNTTADCPDPSTVCKNGGCEANTCSPDSGTGTPFGTCDVDGSKGTCIPSATATGFPDDVCILGGTVAVGGACQTNATRSQPGDLCVPGSVCIASGTGTLGTCGVACHLGATSDATACPDGTACGATLTNPFAGVEIGACLPVQGSGTSACVTGVSNELEPCNSTASCGCVNGGTVECTTDAAFYNALTLSGFFGTSFATQTFCERTCSTNADCPDPLTVCSGSGHCSYNLCGNADAGTGFGASCDAGGGSGICYPSWQDYEDLPNNPNGGPGLPYGICIPGGTIADGSPCSPTGQNRTAPSTLCIAGDVCAPTVTGGICRATCLVSESEVDDGALCTGGGTCDEDAIGGVIGYCCASIAADGTCQ